MHENLAIKNIVDRNNQSLGMHKSYRHPDFSSETILTKEPWEYVLHFLSEKIHIVGDPEHIKESIYFWQQGKNLYKLASQADNLTKPLLLYYCFLNTTKALLAFNKELYKGDHKNLSHGINQLTNSSNFNKLLKNASSKLEFKSNEDIENKVLTQNDTSKTKLEDIYVVFTERKGVLTKLVKYFDEPIKLPMVYSLEQLVSNLVFVHRAYSLNKNITIKDQLFIPLNNVDFVEVTRDDAGLRDFGYRPNVEPKYWPIIEQYSCLSLKYEKINHDSMLFIDKPMGRDYINEEVCKNHLDFIKTLRKKHQYIAGFDSRWYLKKGSTEKVENLKLHPLVILFAIFHCLSEFARYNPLKLRNMLDPTENNESWLLNELIEGAGFQFIDLIASEITGKEFKIPRSH